MRSHAPPPLLGIEWRSLHAEMRSSDLTGSDSLLVGNRDAAPRRGARELVGGLAAALPTNRAADGLQSTQARQTPTGSLSVLTQ